MAQASDGWMRVDFYDDILKSHITLFKWLYFARGGRVKSWIIVNIFNRQATQAGVDGAIHFILCYFSFSFLPSNIKAFSSSSSVCHLAILCCQRKHQGHIAHACKLTPLLRKKHYLHCIMLLPTSFNSRYQKRLKNEEFYTADCSRKFMEIYEAYFLLHLR